MKQKLLITGSGGFVAGSVVVHAKDDWEVHAIDRIDIPEEQGCVNSLHAEQFQRRGDGIFS